MKYLTMGCSSLEVQLLHII